METNSIQNQTFNDVIFGLEQYCEETEINKNIFLIHFIEVDEVEEIVNVTITLERPGIFIGKAGSTINQITTFLTMYLNKTVKIHLKEFNPWKLKFS